MYGKKRDFFADENASSQQSGGENARFAVAKQRKRKDLL